jgi:adenylate cyclase, class 2
MSDAGQENEAKFHVRDLNRIKSHLEELGAHMLHERILERNIRFDLPGALLRADGRVLRLRRDTESRLTYKSASKNREGVLSREEIEFVVEDFDKAKRFLEALGYQKLIYYEKYRTTYNWNETLIMLDELPYGKFVEIEGDTVESIRATASQLHLKWDCAIAKSYHALFEQVRKRLSLPVQDLSFAEFRKINVSSSDLGVDMADQ